MRPLFAIAPLALAFALLGPTTTEAANPADSLVAKVWHMVFDHDEVAAGSKPGRSGVQAGAQAH